METKNSFISSANVKVQGRTAYYKMLEAVRQGELIQVCRGVYANIDQLSACMVDILSLLFPTESSAFGLPGISISLRHPCRKLIMSPSKGIERLRYLHSQR